MCILLEATPIDPRHSQFEVPNASYFRYLVFTISNTNELLASEISSPILHLTTYKSIPIKKGIDPFRLTNPMLAGTYP